LNKISNRYVSTQLQGFQMSLILCLCENETEGRWFYKEQGRARGPTTSGSACQATTSGRAWQVGTTGRAWQVGTTGSAWQVGTTTPVTSSCPDKPRVAFWWNALLR